ncbi:Hint domain-containing protein [Gymnodinialimonas hymeniacidonis]|uniref:Hint domain-containing protein n=1 Tax=Gymnodinialimonas hymeniacidonis TaxID=3126508 RepID=UPI0034C5DFBB
MSWHAIWSEGRVLKAPQAFSDAPLRSMTLWLELSGPRRPLTKRGRAQPRQVPLRLWRGMSTDPGKAITIYLMPDNALRLVHGDIDLMSAPNMMRTGETVGLRYVTCAEGRNDTFDVTNFDQGRTQSLRAGLAHLATMAEACPAAEGYLKVAHIAAVAPDLVPATDLPGVESGAIIATDQGPRPVDALQAGDMLLDASGEAHPLRWIEARPRLCMGRNAPMRLRAPYFGLARDLIVTPQTRILQTGPVVDYLCGTDAVLAQVGDLANGRAVFRDRHQAVRTFYHMMLDDPACILVENCPIETAHLGDVMALGDPNLAQAADPSDSDLTPSLPLLDRASARALLTANSRAA